MFTWHGMRGWSHEHESYTGLTLFSEELQKNNDLVQTRLFRLHTAGGKTQKRCLGKNIEGGSLYPNRKVRPGVYDRDVSTNTCWWRWHSALSGTPWWDVQAEDSLLLCSKGAAAALYPLETIRGMTDPCSCVLLPTDCMRSSSGISLVCYIISSWEWSFHCSHVLWCSPKHLNSAQPLNICWAPSSLGDFCHI